MSSEAESTKEIRSHRPIGGEGCFSYRPGHRTHWMAALKRYVISPRQQIWLRHIEGNEFEAEFDGVKHRWFHHDPKKLIGYIERDPENFTLVTGTTFVNSNFAGRNVGGVGWFFMGPSQTVCYRPNDKRKVSADNSK